MSGGSQRRASANDAEAGGPKTAVVRRAPIPAERQARVIEFIRRAGVASIHRIAAEIQASASTIRRDLDELTERGYLVRTHGGAMFQSHHRTTFEPSREIAEQISAPAKAAIGRYAATLVSDGQSVIFDSSSTVLEAARTIARQGTRITAVTNDLGIAHVLAGADTVKLIVPGGTLRPGSLTLMGEPGLPLLASLTADIAFIGAHALAGSNPSETSLEIVAVKRALIGAAQQKILLADSTKFESPAFCTICPVERFQEIVTDAGIRDADRAALEERGVKVSIVSPGNDVP